MAKLLLLFGINVRGNIEGQKYAFCSCGGERSDRYGRLHISACLGRWNTYGGVGHNLREETVILDQKDLNFEKWFRKKI